MRFTDKVVLVTGAASGIGREACLAFAEEGASVVAIDRSDEGLQQTARQISELGGQVETLQCDLTDEAAVKTAFDKAIHRFGKIDCAFNNAGVAQSASLTDELSLTEWERILRTNVTAVWLCMREELRRMVAQGSGAIVNTASMMSFHCLPRLTAYTTSKHAIMGLTKSAALEYAQSGVRVNAVAPGGVPTGMMSATLSDLAADQRDAAMAGLADSHPMKRLGTPREVANAVLFLCSDQASFTTGSCLGVDGGWSSI